MFAKIRSWFAKSETKCAESSSIDSNEIVNTMVADFEQIDHLMRLFTRDQFVEKKREIEALLNDKQKSAELAKTAIDFVITNRDQCSYPWHQTEI